MGQLPKVLQIISYASVGGAEKYVWRLTRGLAQRGFASHVITPPGPISTEFGGLKNLGVAYEALDLRKHPFAAIRRIRDLVRNHGVTLIHSHMYLADVMVFLATFDLKGVVRISTIHMSIKNQWPASWLRKQQQRICSAIAFLKYEKVFAVSESMRREVKSYFMLSDLKAVTVYNSIDFAALTVDAAARARLISRYGLERPAFRIGCVGALNKLKSQITLIEALGEHLRDMPDIEVYLLGEGDQREFLREAVERYGLSARIHFLGVQGDMSAWYSLMDASVLASLTEGLSTSILEAMYMGIPVVASDIPANRELVKEGETGFLFHPVDARKLADTIRTVRGQKSLAAGYAETARRFVSERFGLETMIDTILSHARVPPRPSHAP